jgi:hypothetical protein
MSSPIKQVLDVLALQGDLEWARCVGGGNPPRPPFVAWRFKAPDVELERRIAEAVRSYEGPVEWIVRKGDRNWVIEPSAFWTYAASFRVDVEALQGFGEEFPSETKAALDDAAGLAAHLDRELALSPLTPGPPAGGPTR